jgi:hypothetical protein
VVRLADGNTLNAPIEVADVTAKSARAGVQVVVELTEYPSGPRPARGVITKRLGRRGEAAVAVRSIIYQHHLPETFPEEVLEEARASRGPSGSIANWRSGRTFAAKSSHDRPRRREGLRRCDLAAATRAGEWNSACTSPTSAPL